MKQHVCSICSYTYDETKGIPEKGIAPGTKWEELPEDWKCPLCGADKSQFQEKGGQAKQPSEAENRQISRSNRRYSVTSRPSSESMYARSCPSRTKSRPVHSLLPLCRALPFFTFRATVPVLSLFCCCALSCAQTGKKSRSSIEATSFPFHIIKPFTAYVKLLN